MEWKCFSSRGSPIDFDFDQRKLYTIFENSGPGRRAFRIPPNTPGFDFPLCLPHPTFEAVLPRNFSWIAGHPSGFCEGIRLGKKFDLRIVANFGKVLVFYFAFAFAYLTPFRSSRTRAVGTESQRASAKIVIYWMT